MLNEKGFGMKEIMMTVIVMFLAVVVTMFLYDRNFKSLFEGNKDIESEPTIQYKYEEAEKKLQKAAKEYVQDTFNKDDIADFNMTITSKTLISKNYLNDFSANGNACTGYVKLKENSYKAYINCGDYITEDY